ncbi:MAG: SprT-like domain-containing protein [Clostridiales bacterium]|nr:SprT-like domain-containing protein [Clostridiales bacterium]
MKNVWNETAIRNELAKLDRKTGLKGAELPITFNNKIHTLGSYSSADGGAFRFSGYYFGNSSWPIEEAIDTIRHEYAHYMDHKLYGCMGHGPSWKKCCREVGALPIRCYSKKRAQYYIEKREAERRKSAELDGYKTGCFIRHPKFGNGKIVEIIGTDTKRCAVVLFKNGEKKKLSLSWIDENCERL